MNNNFQKFELLSEKGSYKSALILINNLIFVFLKKQNIKNLLQALVHRAHIWKHFYQKTEDRNFLDFIYSDLVLALNLSSKHGIKTGKENILLRLGDYFFELNQLSSAEKYYLQSLKYFISKKKDIRFAEFLSHHALALAKQNKYHKALKEFSEAINLAEQDSGCRIFHKKIIVSGIYLRLAKANIFRKDKNSFKNNFKKALVIAKDLKYKHKMPMRYLQLNILRKTI